MTERRTGERDQRQGTIVFAFCIGMLGAKILHVFQEWFCLA